jgi:hypothetical protein
MKIVIIENTWRRIGFSDFGWGNGYVLIPKNNPLHGKHYDEINVDVHGGLTFSELLDSEMIESWKLDKEDEGKWCVGFDTAHYGDNLSKWTKEKVQEEAEKLKKQLINYKY